MSAKLVFTVSSAQLGEEVVNRLRTLGVEDDAIGFIANEGTTLSNLPEADLLQNDVIPAIKRGGTAGALVGVVAGLGVSAAAAPGLLVGGAGLALATLGGASFGTLVSALVGAAVPNRHLEEYEELLGKGELLLIVDVTDKDRAAIKKSLQEDFPSLKLEDTLPPATPIG